MDPAIALELFGRFDVASDLRPEYLPLDRPTVQVAARLPVSISGVACPHCALRDSLELLNSAPLQLRCARCGTEFDVRVSTYLSEMTENDTIRD